MGRVAANHALAGAVGLGFAEELPIKHIIRLVDQIEVCVGISMDKKIVRRIVKRKSLL